jgi:hypothetical protein
MLQQAVRLQAQERRTTVHWDGGAIVIDMPMTLRRRGKRTEIVLPRGASTAVPSRPPAPEAVEPEPPGSAPPALADAR